MARIAGMAGEYNKPASIAGMAGEYKKAASRKGKRDIAIYRNHAKIPLRRARILLFIPCGLPDLVPQPWTASCVHLIAQRSRTARVPRLIGLSPQPVKFSRRKAPGP
jgi:hypothetical protein